jgi:TP901 family phage tail tape measure protein
MDMSEWMSGGGTFGEGFTGGGITGGGGGGIDAGTVEAHVGADTTQLEAGFRRGIKQTDQFAAKLEQSLRRIGASFSMLGRRAMLFGSAMGAAIGYSIKQFGEFDSAMRRATSVSEVTQEQFEQMSMMAEEAAHQLNMSAIETADGFYRLGEAGLTVTEQMQAYLPTLKFARLSQMSVNESTEILVDTINGLGMSFDQTTELADIMTQTFINATIDLEEVGQSTKLVAAIVAEMGTDILDVTAAFALMAKAGVKGSQAGTALRRAFTNMLNPSRDLQKILRSWNIDMFDANDRMKTLAQIIMELSDALADATPKQKGFVTASLFGDRAISGMLTTIRNGGADFDIFRQKLEDSAGTMDKVLNKQLYAVWQQLGMLFKNFARLRRHIVATIEPAMRRFKESVDPVISRLVELVDQNQEVVKSLTMGAIKFTVFITAAGALTLALGTLSWSLANVISGFRVLYPVLAKIGLLFTGITAPIMLIGGILYVIRAQWKQYLGDMAANMQWLGDTLRFIWNALKLEWYKFARGLAWIWDNMIKGLVDSFKNFGQNLIGVWGGIKKYMQDPKLGITGIFTKRGLEVFSEGFVEGVESQPVKKAVDALATYAKTRFDTELLNFKAFASAIGESVGMTWEAVATQMEEDLGKLRAIITEHAPELAKYIDFLDKLRDLKDQPLPSPFEGAGEKGDPAARERILGKDEPWWSTGIQGYIDQVMEAFPTFTAYITELMRKAALDIEGVFGQTFKGLMKNIHDYKQVMLDFVEGIGDALSEMFSQFLARWVMMKSLGMAGFNIGSMGGEGTGFFGSLGFAMGGILRGGFQNFARGFKNINQPTLAAVGEGPFNEAIVPLPDGRRIPVDLGPMQGLLGAMKKDVFARGDNGPINLHLSAIDGPSTLSFFRRNMSIMQTMLAQLRNRNPASRRAYF